LGKATISFVVSISPSIRLEKLGSLDLIFTKFEIWVFLLSLLRKFNLH